MNTSSSPRNAIADTVAAVVVSIILWALVSMAVHALWYILDRLRGMDKIWLQVAGREIICPIVGTYAGIRAGKKWFPAAKIEVVYFGFAAVILALTIALPIWLSSRSDEPWNSRDNLLGMLAGAVSVFSGFFIADNLKRDVKE